MSAGIEIPLSRVAAVGEGKLLQCDGALMLVTARSRHGGAAAVEVPRADSDPLVISVRLTVESGQLLVGWRNHGDATWTAQAVVARTVGAIDVPLSVLEGTVGGRLVFDNAADSGQ